MNQFIVQISLLLVLSLLFISLLSSPTVAQNRSAGTTMPTARSEITATNIGDDIYVIGGFDGSGDILDILEVYNVKSNSWKSVAPLP